METIDENTFLKNFGQNLKRLRIAKHLTQANVAFEANMSVSQIQRIEYGQHNFTILTLLSLSKALDLKPAELLQFMDKDLTK
ncbi:hypothetical protein AAE02nite_10300 [Adhaeribacter aerolatus]|uniref:HTH cro/C1-type domain-containing protein n=1 Tax=Adhaeribacter aerolatus TaxID=670289 RepID=A0A512AUH4_9BACT|nr:helix-turn-helix transcriptional regulator [Adhaeribacter aerolatus]GEO03366.1 hypothetical protein AAE02nite_10300 [Adhaeribacter aerolatus]